MRGRSRSSGRRPAEDDRRRYTVFERLASQGPTRLRKVDRALFVCVLRDSMRRQGLLTLRRFVEGDCRAFVEIDRALRSRALSTRTVTPSAKRLQEAIARGELEPLRRVPSSRHVHTQDAGPQRRQKRRVSTSTTPASPSEATCDHEAFASPANSSRFGVLSLNGTVFFAMDRSARTRSLGSASAPSRTVPCEGRMPSLVLRVHDVPGMTNVPHSEPSNATDVGVSQFECRSYLSDRAPNSKPSRPSRRVFSASALTSSMPPA